MTPAVSALQVSDGVSLAALTKKCVGAVPRAHIQVPLRRDADDTHAPQRKAGVAQDVPAEGGAMTGAEGLQERVALVDDDGYACDIGITRVPKAE
jgi:hypothetical protein